MTDVLTDHTVEFLSSVAMRDFAFYRGHEAIHTNIQQANDDRNPASADEAAQFVAARRHRG